MAKGSQKIRVRRAKDRLLRVWGVISTLDFCYFRSPREALVYERRISKEPAGSGKSTCKIIGSPKSDENLQGTRVDREGTTSVKTLIEEELGEDYKQSDSSWEGHRKKKCKQCRTRSKHSQPLNQGDLEDGKNWEFDRSCQQNTGQGLGNILSHKNMVEKTFHQIYPNHTEERPCEAAKEVLHQQLISEEHEGPVNVIQNLQDSYSVREKVSNSVSKSNLPGFGKYEQLNFYGKKAEFPENRASNETRHSRAIIILKSELMHSDTANSQKNVVGEDSAKMSRISSLSSIKRRLRSAISFGKDHFYVENATRIKAGEENHKAVNNSELTASKINFEAKKYPSQMLSCGEEGLETLSATSIDKLGRILPLPEFSYSPEGIPRSDTSPSAKSRFFEEVKFPRDVGKIAESNSVFPAEHILETESNIYGIVTEETAFTNTDHTNLDENTGLSEKGPEKCSTAYLCADEKDCGQQVRKNFDYENDPVPCLPRTSALSTAMGKAEDPETGIDKAEQPSPVSVLEPLFIEDDYSSTTIVSQSRGHPIQLLQINFEDRDDFTNALDIYMEILNTAAVINYVKAVLHTFELNWDQLYLKSLSLDQLLESPWLREVDFSGDLRLCNRKLLLDCINEVLLEFCNHYFVLPWFYFSNKIQAVHKVCERVYWHLLQPPIPRSLEQIVRKDLSGLKVWMNPHLEVKDLGVDIGKTILEELIQETFMSSTIRTLESEELPSFPAGHIESQASSTCTNVTDVPLYQILDPVGPASYLSSFHSTKTEG